MKMNVKQVRDVAINKFVSNATITFLVSFFLPMFVITSKDFSELIKAAGELNLSSADARGGGIVSLVLVVVDVIIFYELWSMWPQYYGCTESCKYGG